jgi:hypothetical protein
MPYLDDLGLAISDFLIKVFDFADHLLFQGGLSCFYQKAQNLVIVALNQCGCILMDNSDIALKGFHDISEKSILLHNISLKLSIDNF